VHFKEASIWDYLSTAENLW